MPKEIIKEKKVVEDKFLKKQLLEYKEFVNDVDIINAIFDDTKEYSIKEAKSIIEKFKKKEVR